MSIVQGGAGFPFLANAVFTYMCTKQCTHVEVSADSAPDPLLGLLLDAVQSCGCNQIIICYVYI